ncbi:MAG: M1 family metallopeptidase [Acidobacteriota bacterium]|jgi:hypothetical protein
MRVSRMLFVLVAFASAPLLAQQVKPIFKTPLSPRNANYTMSVSLNAKTHVISGTETVTWKNLTADTVPDAWFHLYQNAFANNRTVFMRESGGQLRGDHFNGKGWGWERVKSISQVVDGRDVPLKQQFPKRDQVVMSVALAKAVPPGGQAVFHVTFETKLPKVFARSGYAGTFNMAGQWFPKLGVYEQGRGWNCHEYHANSEFFSDFGVYNVDITVPENYTVGTTGLIESVKKNQDGTKTLFCHAEDVHDFAWAADSRFLDRSETWEGIKIRVLMQPGNRNSISRYFTSVKQALEYFAAHIEKYPYPQITIIDPPEGGMGAGGMEYPTLITADASPFLPKRFRMQEMVVIHEFGHQYWYGMEADNEFERAWLDEGINSYYEMNIMDHYYGKYTSILDRLFGFSLSDMDEQRASYSRLPDTDPISQDSWKYESFGTYGGITYGKSALVLKTMENLIGKPLMEKAMRTFFQTWKFRHPYTHDFLDVFGQVAGKQNEALMRQMLETTDTIDFRVLAVRNHYVGRERGYDLTRTPPERFSTEKSKKAGKKGREAKGAYRSQVVIQRRGALVLPVDVKVTFADGKSKVVHWDGQGAYTIFHFTGSRVTGVLVDPVDKVPLELKKLNNGWSSKRNSLPAKSVGTRFGAVFQGLLSALLNLI